MNCKMTYHFMLYNADVVFTLMNSHCCQHVECLKQLQQQSSPLYFFFFFFYYFDYFKQKGNVQWAAFVWTKISKVSELYKYVEKKTTIYKNRYKSLF